MLRKELAYGIVVLICLFSTIVLTQLLLRTQIPTREYMEVDTDYLQENPIYFEGIRITFSATVDNITESENGFPKVVGTLEGLTLLCNFSLEQLDTGAPIFVRGVSHLLSQDYIDVHEVQIADTQTSLIYSIPGLAIFVIVFFSLFTVNPRKLCFEPRWNQNA